MTIRIPALLAVLALGAPPARAELRLPRILGDHMVLQRGKPARIWGWAEKGERVTVEFAGQTKTVAAGDDGAWVATLDPLEASAKGRTLTVRGAKSRVTLRDVVVGEVWVFARQSTIDVSLAKTEGGAKAAAEARQPAIRTFALPAAARPKPQDDFPPEGDLSGGRFFHSPIEAPKPRKRPDAHAAGPWRVCDPSTAGAMSGAAYHFAKGLQAKLGVPVGVVDLAMGPSVLGSWMSREVLEMAGTSDTAFGNAVPQAGALADWSEAEARAKYEEALAKWENNLARRHKQGESTNLIKPVEPIHPGYLLLLPGGCYNACILPMRRLALRGVLLYQGANHPYFPYPPLGKDFDPAQACNAYYSSYTYKKFIRYGIAHKNLPALLPDWRRTFGDPSLAFGILQPCGSGNGRHARDVLSSQLARFREVQATTCREDPRAGLISVWDLAQVGSRQPRDEAAVGGRCLLWALAQVYGHKGIAHSGPVYKSMAKKGSRIVIQFTPATARGLRALDGGELRGFVVGRKVLDAKGKTWSQFVPASARLAGGGRVEVWSEAIAEPLAVRYAWATVPEGNLANAEGLPAVPFRTDDWAAEDDGFRALPDDLTKPMSEWAEPSMLLYGEKVALETLGPTGLRGYRLGRNILVGAIEPGSPADGTIEINDALIGANGRMFGDDPRVVLGEAIDESQTEAGKGVLRLKLMRSGQVREIPITLEVVGSYSPTSPYECPKAAKILRDARDYVIAEMGADANGGMCGAVSGLLLLSSGDPRHLDPVRRIVGRIVPSAMKLKPKGESHPWNWHPAYEAVFLAEYYMATGDPQVLPALERYAEFFAYSQDDKLGAWGHHGAPGKHNYTYAGAAKGRVNAVGTICFMAWCVIRECGIQVDEAAFRKADTFFRTHVVEGVVGYGAEPIRPLSKTFPAEDRGKGLLPGCNGKGGATAVNYFLTDPGGKIHTECAAVVADSYRRREHGHGGEFYSYVWGPIGASLGDRRAFMKFMAQQRWYYALCRRWDHGWSCQYGGGDSVKYLRYGPEFPTGGYALAYAIPGKGLRVLGGPQSVFGRKLPTSLAAAKAHHDRREYARCAHTLRVLLKTAKLEARTAEMARALLAATEKMDASVGHTLGRIGRDIASGDLYMARARLAALEPILPPGDARLAPFRATLEAPKSAPILDAGKTFYANHGKRLASGVRFVEGVAVDARARRAMEGLARSTTAGIYARWAADLLKKHPSEEAEGEEWVPLLEQNKHPWRLACAERERLLPADWNAPDCDESAWYHTTFPNTWWLDHWAVLRTHFHLKAPDEYRKLRLSMRFEFCLDTEVYLNGRKIVRCERGVCAEPSVVLGTREMGNLKKGDNVLVVKSLNWFRWNGITMHPFKVRLDGLK